ncbi:hypothetical protein GR160_00495 [Flavobacterium sp. Sd200]|uniref:hypothetical protein n=1 Tax=Flavobacterium sp. Sd200 TaxID=2692211 RepID=UPI0013684F36|nr:hypothetical protein [Flavobacterium sp. Sd200]MXN89692.1 hypothetical protein [Flavobacterium sp. Sd200]
MKKLFLLIAAVALLQSCNEANVVENKNIDTKLRETINSKNKEFVSAMATTNINALFSLESDEYRKLRKTSRRKPADLFKRHILKDNFTVYDEFWVTSPDRYTENKVTSKDHGYTFTFTNDKIQSYVSVLKVSGYQFDALLAITYGLTDEDGWKVYAVDLFNLGNWGKTLLDYYNMAKENEQKGYLVNAYTYARNASEHILEDEDLKLKWEKEKHIKLYVGQLADKILSKYSFPLQLKNIKTKPAILSVEPKAIYQNIVPEINYYSTISIFDTIKLKQEKEAIKKELRKSLPELNVDTPMVFRVFDSPNGNGNTYHFIDK